MIAPASLPQQSAPQKQSALCRPLPVRSARIAVLAGAAALSVGALTATAQARRHSHDPMRAEAYQARPEVHLPAYSMSGPLMTVQPNDVVKDGVIIGRDPDPFIRGEILRHYGAGGVG